MQTYLHIVYAFLITDFGACAAFLTLLAPLCAGAIFKLLKEKRRRGYWTGEAVAELAIPIAIMAVTVSFTVISIVQM